MAYGRMQETFRLIDYALSKIADDPRCGAVAREVAAIAKSIERGVEMVERHLQSASPALIRLEDGKAFVEADFVWKTLGLLMNVDDARQRIMMATDEASHRGGKPEGE